MELLLPRENIFERIAGSLLSYHYLVGNESGIILFVISIVTGQLNYDEANPWILFRITADSIVALIS